MIYGVRRFKFREELERQECACNFKRKWDGKVRQESTTKFPRTEESLWREEKLHMFHLKSCQEVSVAGTQRAREGSGVRTWSVQPGHEERPLQSEQRSTNI